MLIMACRETCSGEGSSVQCLGCKISKRGTLSAACQQPSLSSRHEAASVRHQDSLSNRDQPVQRVVWFNLSRFGTYCVVTMHATSRSPMDGGRKARMGLRPQDPYLGPCPRPIDETCATSENGTQLFVICRVVTPKTQWQLQHCPEPFGAALKCHIPTTRGFPGTIQVCTSVMYRHAPQAVALALTSSALLTTECEPGGVAPFACFISTCQSASSSTGLPSKHSSWCPVTVGPLGFRRRAHCQPRRATGRQRVNGGQLQRWHLVHGANQEPGPTRRFVACRDDQERIDLRPKK